VFSVPRPHADGACPHTLLGCDCSDPVEDLDVDELTEEELLWFAQRGTPEQIELIASWLLGDDERELLDVGELLAGQPDGAPLPAAPTGHRELAEGAGELLAGAACGACAQDLDCIRHSPLQHEGW
jgi:hypothetical protein